MACDEAQRVARVRVAAVVGQLPRRRAHRSPRAEAAQLEGCGWAVAVAHHAHPRALRAHLERVHQVGHPLPDLLEVLFAHARGGVQHEHQVIVDSFATCPLGLTAAVPAPKQQHPQEAGHDAPSQVAHGSLVLGNQHFLARKRHREGLLEHVLAGARLRGMPAGVPVQADPEEASLEKPRAPGSPLPGGGVSPPTLPPI